MKLSIAALFTLVVLASHPVGAVEDSKLRSPVATTEETKKAAVPGGDFARMDRDLSWIPDGDYQVSGSCGCTGDAIKDILKAYKEKRKCLLPLQIGHKKTETSQRISYFIAKMMWKLVKYSSYLLTDVDCGECSGWPKNYCGTPTKIWLDTCDTPVPHVTDGEQVLNEEGKPVETATENAGAEVAIHYTPHGCYYYGPPSTYDCCCDVNQVRDLVISTLCTLAEDVIPRDPLTGELILFNGKKYEYMNHFYLATALEYFICGGKALTLTARPFCNAEYANQQVPLDEESNTLPDDI